MGVATVALVRDVSRVSICSERDELDHTLGEPAGPVVGLPSLMNLTSASDSRGCGEYLSPA